MAFGANSAVFTVAVNNPLGQAVTGATLPTGFTAFTTANSLFVALYGNTGTPDKTVAVGSTGYNTGAWVTGNEVTGTGYSAGGIALPATLAWSSGSNYVAFTAGNPSWSGASFTAYGDLVYQNNVTAGTVAKQGVCFHSYGGSAETVASGTFTVAWSSSPTSGSVFNFGT